jgi:hypothetical protein
MSIELGWTAATELAGWLQRALSAARNRRQQRFAHIIGNAGIIVVGLRSIASEVDRLFLPLVYFDPAEWPEGRRREWAEQILALANENVILPRMRAADSALATLASQETDTEIAGLIDQLRLGDHPQGGNLIIQGAVAGDTLIGDLMPEIIQALLAKDPAALAHVRRMAQKLGIAGSSIPSADPGADISVDDPEMLAYLPYRLRGLADAAERTFGFLMGYQQQAFPALPAPAWVLGS